LSAREENGEKELNGTEIYDEVFYRITLWNKHITFFDSYYVS